VHEERGPQAREDGVHGQLSPRACAFLERQRFGSDEERGKVRSPSVKQRDGLLDQGDDRFPED